MNQIMSLGSIKDQILHQSIDATFGTQLGWTNVWIGVYCSVNI